MKKTEHIPVGQTLGFPVLLGLVSTLALMAAGALLIMSGKAETVQIPMLTRICVAVGALLASALAARRASKSRLLWGLAAGGALFVCLVALSLVWLGQPVSLARVGVNFAVTAVASACGGMLGASMKRKKHRKT